MAVNPLYIAEGWHGLELVRDSYSSNVKIISRVVWTSVGKRPKDGPAYFTIRCENRKRYKILLKDWSGKEI